ncbi:MAG: hypothetical protein H6600_02590 [Flavobacteriales bacterium]|nr:hypothetical protein [Flavobacteriales bacterium]
MNSKKRSTSKKKKDASQGSVREEILVVPQSLKILCVLSFMGFIYCLVKDTSDYFAFSNIQELAKSADQSAYEMMETRLEFFKKNDIDISDKGQQRIALMAIYRSIFDILAMVGTALMYFRIKRGFYIYGVFQLLYVIVPFIMFGIGAMVIYDKLALVPPLIYLILFTTQFKHLNR